MDFNQQNLAALFTAVKASFAKGRKTYVPIWPKIATLVPSTTSVESYAWLGQFPRLREWIGDRELKKMVTHSYTLRNKKFEGTVAIPAEAIEDDQYGVYMPMMEEMGYAVETHPDEMLFALLAAGFNTLCYDKQNFFDTDHPVVNPETGTEESVSNMQAGSKAPWFLLDTSRPLKPLIYQRRKPYKLQTKTDSAQSDHVFMADEYVYGVDGRGEWGVGFWQQAFGSKADLTADNFKAARKSMRSLKSDEGRPLGVKPKIIVVGPSWENEAEDLFATETLPGGGKNPLYRKVEIVVVDWLE